MTTSCDLLLLSLGTTHGLKVADQAFIRLLEAAGASVEAVGTRVGLLHAVRRAGAGAYPLVDLIEATAARRALQSALARSRPRTVVFSTTTAALLAPSNDLPYAVRLDAPAAFNRPGALNAVTHALERRRLARARLLLPLSQACANVLPAGSAPTVVVPPPLQPSGATGGRRRKLAVAYTPGPREKGLDLLCAAWGAASVKRARLAVFGVEEERARAFLARAGVPEPLGVEWRGLAPVDEFRATLRSARLFISASAWEDYGHVQLEALVDGVLLVCAPGGGTFEALPLARALEPALVAPDRTPEALAECVRHAFALTPEQIAAYRKAAVEQLDAYRPEKVAATLAERVLPALLET
jgi:glycosyl transferase family 1